MELNGKPFSQKVFKFRRLTVTITLKFVNNLWLVTLVKTSNSRKDSKCLLENTSFFFRDDLALRDFNHCVGFYTKSHELHWNSLRNHKATA